jgi:hypothetical protein
MLIEMNDIRTTCNVPTEKKDNKNKIDATEDKARLRVLYITLTIIALEGYCVIIIKHISIQLVINTMRIFFLNRDLIPDVIYEMLKPERFFSPKFGVFLQALILFYNFVYG